MQWDLTRKWSAWLLAAMLAPAPLVAQVVSVTVTLDANTIPVGGSTTLRIWAQVVPAQQANAERIFSWYLDVLNTNGAAAVANYSSMVRTASDNDPETSSTGVSQGAHRRGIYDTLLNAPTGVGVASPVELMAIPVVGAAAGQTRFGASAGTGVPALSADFLVNPLSGTTPLIGGVYSAAFADLTVEAVGPPATTLSVSAQVTPLGNGTNRVTITFPVAGGLNYTVEYRDGVGNGTWLPLPGGPHNSGTVVDITDSPQRFYRVRVEVGDLRLTITRMGAQVALTFPVGPGFNYTVEYRDALGVLTWQPLPGALHNSGTVLDDANLAHRFYLLKLTIP